MIIKDEILIAEKEAILTEAPNLTKENSSFEEWWNEVIRLYTLGWLCHPMTAYKGKSPYYETWYVPTIEQILEFQDNVSVKNKYQKHYEEGTNPSDALIYMY